MDASEVGDRSGSGWSEGESDLTLLLESLVVINASLFSLLTTSLLIIDLLLHPWEVLGVPQALLRIPPNALLSLVLVTLHHHLEEWDTDSVRHVFGPELEQDSLINIVGSNSLLTSTSLVIFVEGEGLGHGFVLSQGGFLVLLSTLSLILQELIVLRCFYFRGNAGWLDLGVQMFLKLVFLISNHLLYLLGTDGFWPMWVLLKLSEQDWHGNIILSLAVLSHEVLLGHEFAIQSFGQSLALDISIKIVLFDEWILRINWSDVTGLDNHIIVDDDELFRVALHTSPAEVVEETVPIDVLIFVRSVDSLKNLVQ